MRRAAVIAFLLLVSAFPALAGALTSVSLVPAVATVGVETTHDAKFTLATELPANGKVVVTYPAGFALGPVAIVSQANIDGTFAASVSGQVVTVSRNNDGTPTSAGTAVTLTFSRLSNHASVGSYSVTVATVTAQGAAIDGPQTSSDFGLTE